MNGLMKLGLILAVTGVIALVVDTVRRDRNVLPPPWNWIVSGGLLVAGVLILIVAQRAG
ncbi:MAG: hypothetical protein LBH13_05605 [Cellulomonadaceae bacterium]|nr:hypothetical protein [Cellulomonadaceae bacterium]